MASLASFDRKRGAGRPGIAGVDEAGRGPLCGPVVAGAVLLDAGFYGEVAWIRKLSGANDSKKLSPEKRAELRARIAEMHAEGKLRAVWAEASVLEAQNRAMAKAALAATATAMTNGRGASAASAATLSAMGNMRAATALLERISVSTMVTR